MKKTTKLLSKIKVGKISPKKRPRKLGMGLSSLLSKDEEVASIIKAKIQSRSAKPLASNSKTVISKINFQPDHRNKQMSIPIQFLVSGKFQPRKSFDQDELGELAESIKTNGVLQPILVRPLNNSGKSYEIIAGERRWRASQIAKLHEVPVIVRSFDDETSLGVAMIENLQRTDLNLVEEADGYRTLMNKFQYTQEKLSSHLGKSRSHIANVLRILSLPSYVKRHIVSGDISFGHARSLVTLPNDKAAELTDTIIDKDLSVRSTEKIVSSIKKTDGRKSSGRVTIAKSDPNIELLEKELTSLLGLKVIICNHSRRNSGNMTIHYKSLDQLQPVIDKLKWMPK